MRHNLKRSTISIKHMVFIFPIEEQATWNVDSYGLQVSMEVWSQRNILTSQSLESLLVSEGSSQSTYTKGLSNSGLQFVHFICKVIAALCSTHNT